MSILEIIQSNNLIYDQVKHIFLSFQKEFPDVRYDEREEILGIGEPNRYLMCYFKYSEEGNVLVKFKNRKLWLTLPQEYAVLQSLINKTIALFIQYKYMRKEKYKKIDFAPYEKQLKTSDDLKQIKEDFCAKADFFNQKLTEFKEIMRIYVDLFIIDEKKKHITYSLLQLNNEKKTLGELATQYGVSREAINNSFRKQLTRIDKKINYTVAGLQKNCDLRNNFMDTLSDCIIDSFILYLKKNGNIFLARAFCVIFIPNNLRDKDFLSFIKSNLNTLQNTKILKTKYKEFTVLVSSDGEFITDIELLDKLADLRKRLAHEFFGAEKDIYTDKQLVLLATRKPTNKESYFSVMNTDKDWELFGCKVVEEINNHTNCFRTAHAPATIN